MIANKKVLALVPAREGSKGLPGKNALPFCGKPLMLWSIEHGLTSKYVDKVLVSTDSSKYAQIALEGGAEVPFLRPESLAMDTASSIDVILHALDILEANGEHYDLLVLLEPTSPLRKTEDIDNALMMLVDCLDAESIVSISLTEAHHPAFLMEMKTTGFLKSYLPDFKVVRRQDLTPVYFLEGTIYISWTDSLRKRRSFHHEKTLGYKVPKFQSFEIDDLEDFIICEALHKELNIERGSINE